MAQRQRMAVIIGLKKLKKKKAGGKNPVESGDERWMKRWGSTERISKINQFVGLLKYPDHEGCKKWKCER